MANPPFEDVYFLLNMGNFMNFPMSVFRGVNTTTFEKKTTQNPLELWFCSQTSLNPSPRTAYRVRYPYFCLRYPIDLAPTASALDLSPAFYMFFEYFKSPPNFLGRTGPQWAMLVDMFQVLLSMFPLFSINEDPFGGKCVCVCWSFLFDWQHLALEHLCHTKNLVKSELWRPERVRLFRLFQSGRRKTHGIWSN